MEERNKLMDNSFKDEALDHERLLENRVTEASPVQTPEPPHNILIITLRQRTALSTLDDERLMRFQMAFNVLVNLVTDGVA
jgi:hypothetical protein